MCFKEGKQDRDVEKLRMVIPDLKSYTSEVMAPMVERLKLGIFKGPELAERRYLGQEENAVWVLKCSSATWTIWLAIVR